MRGFGSAVVVVTGFGRGGGGGEYEGWGGGGGGGGWRARGSPAEQGRSSHQPQKAASGDKKDAGGETNHGAWSCKSRVVCLPGWLSGVRLSLNFDDCRR